MTEQPFDPWKDSWALTSRYEQWIESFKVPTHRAYYIDDLRTIEVGPGRTRRSTLPWWSWRATRTSWRLAWGIPPAGTARPMKFSRDDIIYVVSGYGMATVWSDEGGPKRTFEWQPHSLFLIPRNYT